MDEPNQHAPEDQLNESQWRALWRERSIICGAFLLLTVAWLKQATVEPEPMGGEAQPARLEIDINQATSNELCLLPSIGPQLSQRIIQYRQTHGPFGSLEELTAVHGMGPVRLAQIRPYLSEPSRGSELVQVTSPQ